MGRQSETGRKKIMDPLNGKKTEVTHIRLSADLLNMARGYHSWRRHAHPRLTLQAALGELVYQGAMGFQAVMASIERQGTIEQAVSRSENFEFATKFLGAREAVEDPY
jgi:hypothetical protein